MIFSKVITDTLSYKAYESNKNHIFIVEIFLTTKYTKHAEKDMKRFQVDARIA